MPGGVESPSDGQIPDQLRLDIDPRSQSDAAPPAALPRPGRHQGALAGQARDNGDERYRMRQAFVGLDQPHTGRLHGVVGISLIAQNPRCLHVQAWQQNG